MATIYAYSSDDVRCTYSLYYLREGSTTMIWVQGTLYGSEASSDKFNNLYAHLRYNVEPVNNGSATTYVSSYGERFGDGVLIFEGPLNSTTIPTTGQGFYASWIFENSTDVTYKNCALFLSKSQTEVKSNNNEAYLFIGKKLNNNLSNKPRYYTEDLIPATRCTAPTQITVSPSTQKPGGDVTISWSGAEAGMNNQISGYRVYYKVDKAPNIDSFWGYDGYINIADNSTTSTTFTIPNNATRRSIYHFKIVTKGSPYDSTISIVSDTVTVNTLPDKPSVIPDKTIVPSSGGKIFLNLSANDQDAQELSFYYSTSVDGDKTKIENSSIEINNTGTYYFYTYDGLEYSSEYTTQSFSFNEKPTIGGISNQGVGDPYEADSLSDYSYKNFYTTVSSTLSNLNKDVNNISWYGRYADILENGSISSWHDDLIKFSDGNTLSITLDLSLNPVFKTLSNIVYQIGASYNDGIEDSEIVWGETNFVIAPNPTIKGFFNKHNGSNIPHSKPKHFYDKGSIQIEKDSSVTGISVSIDNGAKIRIPFNSIDNYKKSGYFNIYISDTSTNIEYKLSVTIERVIGSSTIELNITSAGLPYVGTDIFTSSHISSQTNILKPYTSTSTSTFNIVLYNFFETLSYSNAKVNYDGTNLPKSCLSFKLINGENSLDITPTYDTLSSASSLCFNYNQDFYKKFLLRGENPLNLDLDNTNTVDLQITFTDVFGKSYNVTKYEYLTLDFREPFIEEGSSFSVKIFRDGAEISSSDYIRENDSLRFNFEWSAYNNQNAVIESYICRTNKSVSAVENLTNWEKYQNDSNYIWNINTGNTPVNLIRTGSDYIDYTVGRLDKSYYVYFKIVAIINGCPTSYYSERFITQRHTTVPKINFTSVNYNSDDKQLKYRHSNYDTGGGKSPWDQTDTYQGIDKIEFGIQYATDFSIESNIKYIGALETEPNVFIALTTITDINKIIAEETSLEEYTCLFDIDNWTYYNIRLVVRTTMGENIIISYGEEAAIYNVSPTISYRKNHIGINAIPENFEGNDGSGESIKDTSILIIQSGTNRNNIYFITPNHRIKFNINDGRIDGILLDAGNWN